MENKDDYIDLLEKLLELNLDIYNCSLAFYDDMIYLVTSMPGYGIDADSVREQVELLLDQKKKVSRYLWGDSDS